MMRRMSSIREKVHIAEGATKLSWKETNHGAERSRDAADRLWASAHRGRSRQVHQPAGRLGEIPGAGLRAQVAGERTGLHAFRRHGGGGGGCAGALALDAA